MKRSTLQLLLVLASFVLAGCTKETVTTTERERLIHDSGFILSFTAQNAFLVLGNPQPRHSTVNELVTDILRVEFAGANPYPSVAGLGEVSGRFGRLVGSDPTMPHDGLARYRKVKYFEIYPGVDVTYSVNQRRLSVSFEIEPKTDPEVIRISFQSTDNKGTDNNKRAVDRSGQVIFQLGDRNLVQTGPTAHQFIDGKQQEIEVRSDVDERGTVFFEMGSHDGDYPVTIGLELDYGKWHGQHLFCDLGSGPGFFIPRIGGIDNLGLYVENWYYVGGLQAGLENCSIIRNSIVWEMGTTGQRLPYKDWSAASKQILYDYYDLLWQNPAAPLGISCPNPFNNTPVGESKRLFLTADEAFHIYAAHVAWALFLEAKNLLPWSLVSQSTQGREEILASYRYHSRIKPSQYDQQSYYPAHIQPDRDFQSPYQEALHNGVYRCDPRVGYWFVTGQSADHTFQKDNLLGTTQEETLANLTTWFAQSVGHGSGYKSKVDMLQRIFLEDRLKARLDNSHNEDQWLVDSPTGCHTASSLFYDLAKSVNIPLRHVRSLEDYYCDGSLINCTHGGLLYRWDTSTARVLWHTDNIYAEEHAPIFPIDGQSNSLSTQQSKQKYFETLWVPPQELQSWGFEYQLELVDPPLAQMKFYVSPSPYDTYYDYGYFAGYWIRSDRANGAYEGNEPVMNAGWRTDLASLLRREQSYLMCSWRLMKYAQFGQNQLTSDLNNDEQRKKQGFRPWWLRPHNDYWDRVLACANAYGGQQAVIDFRTGWMEDRGYPKTILMMAP